jgi:hypothetical protein
MDLRESGHESMELIQLILVPLQFRAFWNTKLNFMVPQEQGIFKSAEKLYNFQELPRTTEIVK